MIVTPSKHIREYGGRNEEINCIEFDTPKGPLHLITKEGSSVTLTYQECLVIIHNVTSAIG